mgnify:CR=1 FL=1
MWHILNYLTFVCIICPIIHKTGVLVDIISEYELPKQYLKTATLFNPNRIYELKPTPCRLPRTWACLLAQSPRATIGHAAKADGGQGNRLLWGPADARGRTGRWAKAAGARAVGETLACAPQPRPMAATATLQAAAAMAHGCEFTLHFIKKAVLSAETGRAATQDGPFHNVKPAVLHGKSRPARMAHCKPDSWPTGGTAFGR